MPLSDTTRRILIAASQQPLGLAAPPATLPVAALNAVLRSLLRQELVAACSAPVEYTDLGWRQADPGRAGGCQGAWGGAGGR